MTLPPGTRLRRLAPLAILLAAFAAYVRGLDGPFLFDDRTLFLDDGSLAPFVLRTRPLVWLSVALNHALSGADTTGYHALNVLVHGLAGVLVMALLGRVFARLPGAARPARPDALAFGAALLWTLHPLQTQAVAYVVQRAEALAGLLALVYLLAFLRSAEAARPLAWRIVAFGALGLGMATKEWVAMAPLVALCLDRALLASSWRAPWEGRGSFHLVSLALLPLFAWLFIAPALLGSRTAGLTLRDFGPLEYLRTQPGVILTYLRLALWPHPLCLDRGWPITPGWSAALAPGLAILLLLAASAWALVRGPGPARAAGLAGAWFFLFLAPTSSLIPIKDPAVEHRMYLALLSVVAPLVWAVERLTRPRARLAAGVLGLLTLGAAVATAVRVEDYRSGVRMWRATVACAPHHARAWTNLGEELVRADRIDEAVPVLERALELDPESGQAALNLGSALLRGGRTHEAIAPYRRAVRHLENARTHRNLANALLLDGQMREAELHYREALARGAEADDHLWLATALLRQERDAEAAEEFETFLRDRPDHGEAHMNLATALSRLGRQEEALAHFVRAVALDPEGWIPRLNLGRCLANQGRRTEALQELEAAMRNAPGRLEPFLEGARLALDPPADLVRAQRWIDQARERGGEARPDVLEIAAQVEVAQGATDGARATLRRALELARPGSPLARRLQERLDALR